MTHGQPHYNVILTYILQSQLSFTYDLFSVYISTVQYMCVGGCKQGCLYVSVQYVRCGLLISSHTQKSVDGVCVSSVKDRQRMFRHSEGIYSKIGLGICVNYKTHNVELLNKGTQFLTIVCQWSRDRHTFIIWPGILMIWVSGC